jgi:hypothetical protein
MPAGKSWINSMISPVTGTGHRRFPLCGGLRSPDRTQLAAVPMAHADGSGVAQPGPVAQLSPVRSFGRARLKVTALAEPLGEEIARGARPPTGRVVSLRATGSTISSIEWLCAIRVGIAGLPLMPRLRYICVLRRSPREASLP